MKPTGALDTDHVQIMELFTVYRSWKMIITHEPEGYQMCKKTVVLRDGNTEHKR